MILHDYLRKECDAKLPGLLSFGVREAYEYLDKLIENNPILKEPEMNKAYGHIRQGLVDVSLKWVFEKSEVSNRVINKSAKNNKNGYTYLLIETSDAIVSPVKTRSTKHMPKKALHRLEASANPFQLGLFDEMNEREEGSKPFLLLTYGGANHKLDYIELGMPDAENNAWLDKVNIIHSPVMYETHTEKEMKKGLELTFTDAAAKLLKGDRSDVR